MHGPGKQATGRRVSRSLPLSERPRRRFAVGRSLEYGWRRRQDRLNQYSQPFSETPTFAKGRERRRRARDSQEACSSSDIASSSNHSPLGTEAKNSLAVAGVMLATEELDRLSERARNHGELE